MSIGTRSKIFEEKIGMKTEFFAESSSNELLFYTVEKMNIFCKLKVENLKSFVLHPNSSKISEIKFAYFNPFDDGIIVLISKNIIIKIWNIYSKVISPINN